MMRFSRGAALVETALSVSLVLLLVLGTAQMALIAYNQVSADGAAFIATHTAASNPSASPAAIAHSVFNTISAGSIAGSAGTIGSSNASTQAYGVTQSVPGFSLIPGMPSSYTIGGGDLELDPSPPPDNAPVYSESFNAVLYNYCSPHSDECDFPSSHSMYLAQKLVPGGNGVNGEFQEWGCHAKYYDSISHDFPATLPASITSGSALDMTTAGTDEYTVYSWDSGTPCS